MDTDDFNNTGILPPLAERLRPRSLDDYIGQTHLVGMLE